MTAWSDFYSELTTQLGSTTDWTEAELALYTNQAIRKYSLVFPVKTSSSLSCDGSTSSWALPSDFIKVNRVEYVEGSREPRFLEEIQFKPGTQYYNQSSNLPLMWYAEGGYFKLTSTPGSNDTLTLHYNGSHTEIVTDDDTTFTVPDYHLGIISLFVQSRALLRMSHDDAMLRRWADRNVDPGTPQSNPFLPVYKQLEQDFYYELYAALPTGTVELYRKGRGA